MDHTSSTPSAPAGPRRVMVGLIALLAIVGLLVWQVRELLHDPTIFPPEDFVEYWAAGKLNARGQNPYDPALLYDLQFRETTRRKELPVMMWNPPWTLTFVMPFGQLPCRDAQLLWALMNLVVTIVCGDWLWRLYGGPARSRWLAWLLTLTFMPTVFALSEGQIPPLMLLGITAFLAFERRGWHYLAGAAMVLAAIKPHLVYLVWLALAFWGLRGGWRVLVGGTVAAFVAAAIPVAFNAQVLTQYGEAITHRPPATLASPTLGAVIRFAVGSGEGREDFVLQFAPTAIGVLFLAAYAWRHRAEPWDWLTRMPILLLVSFVTASYGAWPFDLVILLPAVIQVAAAVARQPSRRNAAWALAAYALLNVPALILNLYQVAMFFFIWMAPLLLAFYAAFSYALGDGRATTRAPQTDAAR